MIENDCARYKKRKFSLVLKVILAVSMLFCVTEASFANEYYQQGLKAYFESDYAKAKSEWLEAAKQGEVKSMFNLGLLHEQKKIDNAQPSKADEWFDLAGKAGYLPAKYHLALRLKAHRGNEQQVRDLMQDAASKGFLPAMTYLQGDKPITTKIANVIDQQNSSGEGGESPEIQANSKNYSNGYLSDPWIVSKNPNYWTIQMLIFDEESKAQAFIDQHELKDKAAYFLEGREGKASYKLIYGSYKTKAQADFARQNLTKELSQYEPWLRSMESVQTLIKAR